MWRGVAAMVYLILAILSSALVSICMRLSGDRVKNNISLLAVNYSICSLVAAADAGWSILPAAEGVGSTLIMGIIHGSFYLGSFWLLQQNVRKNGVVLSATFMKLGLLVPMTVSLLVFREQPGLLQVIGFVIALCAIVMINGAEAEASVQSRAGLLLLLLAGGGGDAMAKIFEETGQQSLEPQFLLYTFVTALMLCLVLCVKSGQTLGKYELLFGVLIGVPNFLSARFLLKALAALPAVIVYPACSVGTILAVTMAGVAFFGERLGRRQWGALGLTLVSLIFLNL